MKKVLAPLLMLLLFAGLGAGTIDALSLVNLFPDEESTERATQVVVRLDADSTTTTNVTLFVRLPDGSILKDGETRVTVKKGAPLEREFRVGSEFFTQFGEYELTVNESNSGLEDRLNFTITPRPITSIDAGDLVKDPREENIDYIHINVNPQIGRGLGGDDLVDRNLSLYRIIGNGTSGTGFKKELVLSVVPGINNITGDPEAILDFGDLPEGAYELNFRTNITSCATCPKFEEEESVSIRIRDNDINAMSAQLGAVLSLIFTGFLFAYIAFNLDTRSRIAAGLRVFLLMLSGLFPAFAVFTGGHFATVTGFVEAGNYMNYIFLGTFFAWFFVLFVIGVLLYVTDALKISTGDKRRMENP